MGATREAKGTLEGSRTTSTLRGRSVDVKSGVVVEIDSVDGREGDWWRVLIK